MAATAISEVASAIARIEASTTLKEVADVLGVNVDALQYVTLTLKKCRTKDCCLSAAERNNGYCVIHSQTFFPREPKRGHGLYGPSYLHGPGQKNPCSCCIPACIKLGYGPTVKFPSDAEKQKVYFASLGISGAQAQEIKANPHKHHLALWHFDPKHRDTVVAMGKQKNTDRAAYYDRNRFAKAYPPPDYLPAFIATEAKPPSNFPTHRWAKADPMFCWVSDLIKMSKTKPAPAAPSSSVSAEASQRSSARIASIQAKQAATAPSKMVSKKAMSSVASSAMQASSMPSKAAVKKATPSVTPTPSKKREREKEREALMWEKRARAEHSRANELEKQLLAVKAKNEADAILIRELQEENGKIKTEIKKLIAEKKADQKKIYELQKQVNELHKQNSHHQTHCSKRAHEK